MMKLSVVIPVYNESGTLENLIQRVSAVDYGCELEIVIVDDGSDDGSVEVAKSLASRHANLVFLQHEKNAGKGAALRTGFARASGDIVIVQDADLEYDPREIPSLIELILDDIADVVF